MFKHSRRQLLSQNFLHSRQLVKKLVGLSSCAQNDLVIEIGPGKGIITQELLNQGCQVLAIEKDSQLVNLLKQKFPNKNLVLFDQDFLNFSLPINNYKIFSNPPFGIEGKIIRKILDAPNAPSESHLVLRREHALRWAGVKRPSLFFLIYAPWFDFKIKYHFKANDFRPKTKVEAVLLEIKKKPVTLLSSQDKLNYQKFLCKMFKSKKRPISISLDSWVDLFKKNQGNIIGKK